MEWVLHSTDRTSPESTPKYETLNPEPYTLHPKPYTLNPPLEEITAGLRQLPECLPPSVREV